MPHTDTVVGGLRIAGRGLFASADLPVDTLVVEASGVASLNHSCDPNLGWSGPDDLVALRRVSEGEELTFDYATSGVDATLCSCSCRPSSKPQAALTVLTVLSAPYGSSGSSGWSG